MFDAGEVQDQRYAAINALCEECSMEPVSSIVLGGGPLAGFSSRISSSVTKPVIDGTQAAIGMLRSSIRL